MGATVLPSSVKPCSSNVFPNIEDTALSKTPKPWHLEFRLLFHGQSAAAFRGPVLLRPPGESVVHITAVLKDLQPVVSVPD